MTKSLRRLIRKYYGRLPSQISPKSIKYFPDCPLEFGVDYKHPTGCTKAANTATPSHRFKSLTQCTRNRNKYLLHISSPSLE